MSGTGNHGTTRRRFLQHTTTLSTAALAAPAFVPAAALGQGDRPAPSERITLGVIGTGSRGRFLIDRFLKQPDTQIVAVADVDKRHIPPARDRINDHYDNTDCATFGDFRDLLGRDDIDAVIVATPDHWHGLIAVAAAHAGKDIYCEKPLANTIPESRAIVDAVEKNNRILQVGSHERSTDNCRRACELVRNGYIGQPQTLRINLPDDDGHHRRAKALDTVPPEMPVPEGFDYDFWLGHTPKVPYTEKRCHRLWRFNLRYGGGEMTDRGAHVIDIGQLGAGKDHTAPVKLEATGDRNPDSLFDTFWNYRFEAAYADGLRLIGTTDKPRGVRFEGSDGSIFVHIHGGHLEADPASLLNETLSDNDQSLGRSPGHQHNFLDCVKSRTEPMAPARAGHHTAVICHLANIAMLAGRKLRWDPENEQVTNSDHANRLVSPTMRPPWSL